MAIPYKDRLFTLSKDGLTCTHLGNGMLKNRMNNKARYLALGNIFTCDSTNYSAGYISVSIANFEKWQIAMGSPHAILPYIPVSPERTMSHVQIQWQRAKEFFKDNPLENKLKKPKLSSTENSFIKIDNEIYLIENQRIPGQSLLGEGSFGKVKRVRSKAGKEFALKIIGIREQSQTDQNNYQNSITINNILKFLIGAMKRSFLPTKIFKGKKIVRKGYLLLKLHLGIELWEQLKIQPAYNDDTKNIICLNIAEKIKFLHDRNIIHGDIKPSNIMIDGLEVKLFDFGLSTILQRNQLSV